MCTMKLLFARKTRCTHESRRHEASWYVIARGAAPDSSTGVPSAGGSETYGEPNTWNVSAVTEMTGDSGGGVISGGFNEPIGCWDVSGVTNMNVRALLPS